MNRTSSTTAVRREEGSFAARGRDPVASGPAQRMVAAPASDRLKRVADVVIAGAALVLLSPVFLVIAILVRSTLGPKVLFRQERVGRGGRIFEILKFRTMLSPDPARGLESDEQRLTRFGALLRSSSLDELPSLLNLLRGDMSLVGPRPLLPSYLPRYSDEQSRRHDVLPGLTGLAQVSGRNSLAWDAKFELDLIYVRTRSTWLDARILAATVPKVLGRRGVTEEGEATMSDFFGPRRIGGHEMRSAGSEGGTELWEVLDHETGSVVALCTLSTSNGVAEMSLDVSQDVAAPQLVRARGAEMLMGLAREHEAVGARIVIDVPGLDDEGIPARLGLRAQRAASGATGTVFAAHLEGSMT